MNNPLVGPYRNDEGIFDFLTAFTHASPMDEQLQAKVVLDLFNQPALWMALQILSRRLQTRILIDTPLVSVGEAQAMNAEQLFRSISEPRAIAETDRREHFQICGKKWRIHHVYDRQIIKSADIPANRFLVFFLKSMIRYIRNLSNKMSLDYQNDQVIYELNRILWRLDSVLLSLPQELLQLPLASLPLDDQVLQFDSRYRVILRTYLSLKKRTGSLDC